MTTGSSYGGWDGKKSLWTSAGKKKDGFGWGSGGGGGKKPGKWYQGKSWADWDEPPRSAGTVKYSDGEKNSTGTAKSDWDWRKWRPEVGETPGRDVPVTHIEKTIKSTE